MMAYYYTSAITIIIFKVFFIFFLISFKLKSGILLLIY